MGDKQGKRWLVAGLMVAMAPALAQNCRDNIPATAPDHRYFDNEDGTIIDEPTGLIWKQCTEGLSGADCQTGTATRFTWQAALQHAANAVYAGSNLWRLPNKNELASLVEQQCYEPAINSAFFPNTLPNWYWTSTSGLDATHEAWFVGFGHGYVDHAGKSGATYVRLVRDAP